jgi:hypothetical protein
MIASEKQKVKDQIDLRIEGLKSELEQIREQFHDEIDEVCQKALK